MMLKMSWWTDSGDIPASVENLIDIAYIKALARKVRITEITHKGTSRMRLADDNWP